MAVQAHHIEAVQIMIAAQAEEAVVVEIAQLPEDHNTECSFPVYHRQDLGRT